MEQFAAVHKRQNKIELFGRLEGELEGNNEGVIDLRKDRFLGKCVRNFGSRYDVSLSNRFERVDSTSIFFPIWQKQNTVSLHYHDYQS